MKIDSLICDDVNSARCDGCYKNIVDVGQKVYQITMPKIIIFLCKSCVNEIKKAI